MAYIFDNWKKLLDDFQQCVDKGIEEMREQKAEVQQIKVDIYNKIDSGALYRNEQRIVISAPEIIIGNVDKDGTLQNGGSGKVVVKGSEVALDGVGDTGHIISRAPSIRQIAVNPGIDGMEETVGDTSEIVSQACDIVLHSSDAKDVFSQDALPAGQGGIRIHADNRLSLEAAVSAESRKAQIEATVNSLSTESENLRKQIAAQRESVDSCFKRMSKLLDEEAKLNDDQDYLNRVNIRDIEMVHEEMESVMPTLYQATQSFIRLVSQLAEVNRKKKALEAVKDTVKTGDDFTKNTTGASMTIVAETIDVATADGDGNLHTNPEAGINVRTPKMSLSMKDDQGKLVDGGGFAVTGQNISFITNDVSDDGKELSAVGSFTVQAKNICMETVDYTVGDKGITEKKLADDSSITMTTRTLEVNTTNPKDVERDDQGKLTKGEFLAEGDVIIRSKTVTVESLDYEVADGELKTKSLTKDGQLSVRAEQTSFLATDAEGKATGSFSVNAKAVNVKSMDVDKEKLTDSGLAAGSTMTLVSEKMYLGAKSKDVKSKKLQAVSEEVGLFADKTLEAQQGDGKAVVQLDGGNVGVSGSKVQVFGDTTITGKTEVKGDLNVPKATIDNVEAKTSFKSSNISDGIAVPGAPASGSLSTKLKQEDVKE